MLGFQKRLARAKLQIVRELVSLFLRCLTTLYVRLAEFKRNIRNPSCFMLFGAIHILTEL